MRVWIYLSTLLIVYFAYGFYLSVQNYEVVPSSLVKAPSDNFFDYRGAMNVHTDLSLGSSNLLQVVSAARSAGLDFIIITDLNQFGQQAAYDGYFGNTLVLQGNKLSYLDSRLWYLALEQKQMGLSLGEAQTKLADLLTQNRKQREEPLVVLAHPFQKGFTWSGPIPTGLDGFEIINLKTLAEQAWETSKISILWSALIYPFNSRLAFLRLFQEPTLELNLFDQVSTERPFYGFLGSEASARALPFTNTVLKFPSYERTFEVMSTHLLLQSELTGNFSSDRKKILSALRNGQFYLAFDLIGNPKGFSASVESKTQIYPLGSVIHFKPGMKLNVQLPAKPNVFFEVVVYRNGSRYVTGNEQSLEFEIQEPGTYRIQVRVSPYLPLPDAKRWLTWIYTNPFFILSEKESSKPIPLQPRADKTNAPLDPIPDPK